MIQLWYRLKFWWSHRRKMKKLDKIRKASDPWIYEEDNK